MRTPQKLFPLKPAQAEAARPDGHAWVAASAGTGKTQVLSARVLRLLLLRGARPERILCLTFTKLAAAEMQTRIFDRLAHWVRCTDAELAHDLASLHADTDAATCALARRLFALVLDAPGGLPVQTLHAFAQSLIASFPLEADVAPGFATLDDRSALTLRRRLLSEAIEDATAAGDEDFLADLAALSIAGGERRLGGVVAALLAHDEALSAYTVDGFEPALRRAFGLPTDGDAASALAEGLAKLPDADTRRLAQALGNYHSDTAKSAAVRLDDWLGVDIADRSFDTISAIMLTQKGGYRVNFVPPPLARTDPDLADIAKGIAEWLQELQAEQNLYAAAAHAAQHLRVGLRLAGAWRQAKARLGVVDYDDMIEATVRLLEGPGAADWVRYKLDQRIDHLLVDEAQDTNPKQWQIVYRLVEEFFAGQGARDVLRTLFVVGDYKQSIFSFQGSNPLHYRDQRDVFRQLAEDARQDWRTIELDTNFRSVGAVLDVVDAVVAGLGDAFGPDRVSRHSPERVGQRGAVTLWPPVGLADPDAEDDEETEEDADTSLGARQREMAHRTAAAIASWFNPAAPLMLEARGRAVRPEDILVLVRSRSGFSAALVAALHDYGVPVAGVDRLKLTQPLAVQDLLALVRFALQPDDDLTLAALLVSPLIGLTQAQLFDLAHGREKSALWQRLREDTAPESITARDWLDRVLKLADFTAPYEFFETILSQFGGRGRLLARLGEEARDAIDAVLAQALAFEVTNAPSLQGFLAWVEADEIDLKRDPDAPVDAVRLMTVHAAKGLQAPVVILADATRALPKNRDQPVLLALDNGPELPLFVPSRGGLTGTIAQKIAADEADAAREHWRLLYVALTRAEDLLFIGGAISGRKLADDCWYARVATAMAELGAVPAELPQWLGTSLEHGTGRAAARAGELRPADVAVPLSLPAWATSAAPQELRPPRPLSPSAIATDDVAQPPAGPAARLAARRGQALHTLFERLPAVPAPQRRAAALAWAAATAPELGAADLADTVIDILDDPRFAAVFADGALAEAPIAALVGNTVIAGTVDRLLVTEESIRVIDFKTGRRVPADAQGADVYHLKQMAAYVAALERVFPGRPVRAALLYTEGPVLIDLPPELMTALAAPLIAGAAPPISDL